MSTHVIDQKARDMAQSAASKLDAHERECVVRWSAAMQSMDEIKKILSWGTGTLIAALLSIIGFLAIHHPF